MSDLSVYNKQVSEWRTKYNVPEEVPTLDLTKVKIRVCSKAGCGSIRSVNRHHKGHEYLFACLLPDVYAARYVQFRVEDTVLLCEKCHLKLHRLYEPRLGQLWIVLNRQDGRITYKQAEPFRKKLVRFCDRWVKEKDGVRKNKERSHRH